MKCSSEPDTCMTTEVDWNSELGLEQEQYVTG